MDLKSQYHEIEEDQRLESRYRSKTNLSQSATQNNLLLSKLDKSIKEIKEKCINYERNHPILSSTNFNSMSYYSRGGNTTTVNSRSRKVFNFSQTTTKSIKKVDS